MAGLPLDGTNGLSSKPGGEKAQSFLTQIEFPRDHNETFLCMAYALAKIISHDRFNSALLTSYWLVPQS